VRNKIKNQIRFQIMINNSAPGTAALLHVTETVETGFPDIKRRELCGIYLAQAHSHWPIRFDRFRGKFVDKPSHHHHHLTRRTSNTYDLLHIFPASSLRNV